MRKKFILALLTVSFSLGSCQRASRCIEPHLNPPLHSKEAMRLKRCPQNFSCTPSLFPPLTEEERQMPWAGELFLGYEFAQQFDLYRAITCFRRALYLLPKEEIERRNEINYLTALAYYLGKKYEDAICIIETSELFCIDSSFCVYTDLTIILYDSYKQVGEEDKANYLLQKIEEQNCEFARKLCLLSKLEQGCMREVARNLNCDQFYAQYRMQAKSIKQAEMLNAILPGAGYLYLGQRETAITAFLINSLFIAAAAYFFSEGNIAAGIITASLESGWYFGGINGAGIAAKEYNEHLYECLGERLVAKERLHPLFMLKYCF